MALTNNEIKNSKPRDKAYKLSDGNGLFLLIATNGSKYWRFKYRFNGKEKLLALGVYNQITLAEARKRRDKARELLANEVDPGKLKQETKRLGKIVAENSFESIAREWIKTVCINLLILFSFRRVLGKKMWMTKVTVGF